VKPPEPRQARSPGGLGRQSWPGTARGPGEHDGGVPNVRTGPEARECQRGALGGSGHSSEQSGRGEGESGAPRLVPAPMGEGEH
jgi:hypothetical protein